MDPDTTDEYEKISGSSFAAPLVSGAALLVREQWEHLTAAETVEILLETADDEFDGYKQSKYGAGILDVAEALSPQGEVTVLHDDSLSVYEPPCPVYPGSRAA